MSEHTLYDGAVQLTFNEAKHTYSVNGQIVPGVTGITKIIDKSGPLMWWAVNQAIAHIRENYKPDLDEIDFEELLGNARVAHSRQSRRAASVGHMAHDWAAQYLGGERPETPRNPQLKASVLTFEEWAKSVGLVAVDREFRVYSKRHGFAGTCDFDGHLSYGGKRERAIIDWKTGSAVYPEYGFQTAAYQLAREEEMTVNYDSRWIVVFPKDGGEVITKRLPRSDYPRDREAFLAALTLRRALDQWKQSK